MDTAAILAELEAELDRLDKAIALLKTKSIGRRTRRRLSAAARLRISQGMKKRWAERKKSA